MTKFNFEKFVQERSKTPHEYFHEIVGRFILEIEHDDHINEVFKEIDTVVFKLVDKQIESLQNEIKELKMKLRRTQSQARGYGMALSARKRK